MFERGIANTSIDQVRRTGRGERIANRNHYFGDKRRSDPYVVAARRDDVQTFHTQPRLAALDSSRHCRRGPMACGATSTPCIG